MYLNRKKSRECSLHFGGSLIVCIMVGAGPPLTWLSHLFADLLEPS